MHRPRLGLIGIATVVILAGCSGFLGNPTPTESTTPISSDSSNSSVEKLENASIWIGGTIASVGNNTLYVNTSQYNDVVVPISMEEGVLFNCQTNGESCQSVELRYAQTGQDVCAFVQVKNRTIVAVKVFIHAGCTWQPA